MAYGVSNPQAFGAWQALSNANRAAQGANQFRTGLMMPLVQQQAMADAYRQGGLSGLLSMGAFQPAQQAAQMQAAQERANYIGLQGDIARQQAPLERGLLEARTTEALASARESQAQADRKRAIVEMIRGQTQPVPVAPVPGAEGEASITAPPPAQDSLAGLRMAFAIESEDPAKMADEAQRQTYGVEFSPGALDKLRTDSSKAMAPLLEFVEYRPFYEQLDMTNRADVIFAMNKLQKAIDEGVVRGEDITLWQAATASGYSNVVDWLSSTWKPGGTPPPGLEIIKGQLLELTDMQEQRLLYMDEDQRAEVSGLPRAAQDRALAYETRIERVRDGMQKRRTETTPAPSAPPGVSQEEWNEMLRWEEENGLR